MRLLQYLNEKFEDRVQQYGKSFELFSNPSRKEMKDVVSNMGLSGSDDPLIRFLANNARKKLYVWSISGPLHADLWNKKFKGHYKDDIEDEIILSGYAERQGGKWVMEDSDGNWFVYNYLQKIENREDYIQQWKWVDKYIKVTNFLRRMP